MGRVDAAAAGVFERDKWRHRVAALETALNEILDRRRLLEIRLHRVHRELSRLELAAREFVEVHGRIPSGGEVAVAARGQILR
jgi:hypothetical protein